MIDKIEILTINYNTPDLIDNLIKSVREIEGDYQIRIIDGSDKEPFKTEIQNVCKKFNNIILQEQGWNIHHGRGMDFGVSTSNYEWCLIIDSDNYIQQPIIEKMYGATIYNKKIIGWTVPNYSRDGVSFKYYHPALLLINVDYYKELKIKGITFVHDGAPCYKIMRYLHDNNLSDVVGVDLEKYLNKDNKKIEGSITIHKWRGTGDRFGYDIK